MATAAALVVIELASQVAVLGQKRGLAQQLSENETRDPSHTVADALTLSLVTSLVFTGLLLLFPKLMFPNGANGDLSWLLVFTILPFALTEVALAACAYRFDIGATVRSRAIVEPWAISIAAGALFFVVPDSGLELAYVLSIIAAAVVAFMPVLRHYGMPTGWAPHPVRMFRLAMRNLPLAGADAIEWGTRKLDLAILAQFASPAQVGVYFAVQQVATLPQKLKTSFDPILGPVITAALKVGDRSAIAKQVCQVGFWIVAMQAGIALALAAAGADIAAVGRSAADETAEKVRALGRRCELVSADLSSIEPVTEVVDTVVDKLGRLDILVNNAGIIRREDALDFSEADWDAVMDTNLKTLFFLCQAAARHMTGWASQDGERGKIVNVASLLSFQGGIRVPSYTASKSGVGGLTKLLANEWAPRGINVNAIAPGYIATNNTAALQADETRNRQILERIPEQRWGNPADIGGAAGFLSSRAADYVQGHILAVDGGWLAR